ncbi:hypothetical protein LI328DRAFT_133353 [Trichoderma asperelloides]|nr:hypothetical protein LI328DRAFT_133353 [Trichoderma asperelloides]
MASSNYLVRVTRGWPRADGQHTERGHRWTGLALRYSPRRAGAPGDCHCVCMHKVLTGCVQRASRLNGPSWSGQARLHKILILTAPCGGPRVPTTCETSLTQERALCRDTTTTSLVSDSPSRQPGGTSAPLATIPSVRGWLNTIDAGLIVYYKYVHTMYVCSGGKGTNQDLCWLPS